MTLRTGLLVVLSAALAAGQVSTPVGQLPLPGRRKPQAPTQIPDLPKVLRGFVEKATAEQLVIQADDTRVLTLLLSPKTMVTRQGRGIPATSLQPGDRVEVNFQQDEKGLHASLVRVLPPEPGKPATEATAVPEIPPPRRVAGDEDDEGPPKLKHGKPAPRPERPRPAAAGGQAEPEPPAPPKPPDPRTALVEKAKGVAESFSETLPNYLCQQFTTRFVSNTRGVGWDAQDVVSAAVVYEDGKESYRNIAVNGKPVNKPMDEVGGTWSRGEFGSVLRDLFHSALPADFKYAKDSKASNRPAAVYDFEVAQKHSNWTVHASNAGQSLRPAYTGSVWIDKETARVMRIEIQAIRLPEDFPFGQVEQAVDYDFVRLGPAQQYLLPVRAENLACLRHSRLCSRNVIEFRNYKRFTAESAISFDKVKN